MLFTVYLTTNRVNGKYYFGVHKTDDPNDDYLGSGKHLKYAVAKYGRENFTKEILLCSDSPDTAFDLEYKLVEEHRGKPLCYNLRQGGSGGFDYINRVGLNGNAFKTEESVRRGVANNRKRFSDPEVKQKVKDHMNRIRLLVDPDKVRAAALRANAKWRGSKHSDVSRLKMSQHALGNKARTGNVWINKNGVVAVLAVEDIEDKLDEGWERGRIPALERKKIKRETPPRIPHDVLAPLGTHWCSTHQDYLPVEHFHRDKSEPSGLKKYCIECRGKRRGSKRMRGRLKKGPVM